MKRDCWTTAWKYKLKERRTLQATVWNSLIYERGNGKLAGELKPWIHISGSTEEALFYVHRHPHSEPVLLLASWRPTPCEEQTRSETWQVWKTGPVTVKLGWWLGRKHLIACTAERVQWEELPVVNLHVRRRSFQTQRKFEKCKNHDKLVTVLLTM